MTKKRAFDQLLGDTLASGLSRFAAFHLLAFFAAASIAPHRHWNSFEDLVSGGRSDSGVFLEGCEPRGPEAEAQWSSATLRDDDPCLACFSHDFASATEIIEFFALEEVSRRWRPQRDVESSPEP
jgi:hypothetical protein